MIPSISMRFGGATMQGKHATMVSPIHYRTIVDYMVTTRYPARARVMFLLSMKASLRAKEMASLTWAMVTDAQGQVADVMHVPNRASQGKTGGRTIPLHPDLQATLVTYRQRVETWPPLSGRSSSQSGAVGIELRRARRASTFPQAPLRSRTVGFPEYGSDPGFPLEVFPNMRKLKRWLASTPLIAGLPAGSPTKTGSSDSRR